MRNPRNDPLEAHVPERTCILSRRTAPKEELIRLALGPDGTVAPDVRARAPGRGASSMPPTPARTAGGSSTRHGGWAAPTKSSAGTAGKAFYFPRNAPSCPWPSGARMWYISR